MVQDVFTRAVRYQLDDSIVSGSLKPWQDEIARLRAEMLVQPLVVPTVELQELAADLARVLPGLTELLGRREALATWGARFFIGAEGLRGLDVRLGREALSAA